MRKSDIFPLMLAVLMLILALLEFIPFRFIYPMECAAAMWLILNHQKQKKSIQKLLLLSLIVFFLTIFIAELCNI